MSVWTYTKSVNCSLRSSPTPSPVTLFQLRQVRVRLMKATLLSGALVFALVTATPSAGAAEKPKYTGKVVFYSDRAGTFEIYVMRTDGRDVRRLTTTQNKPADMGTPRERANLWPRWSPDGKRIAYQSGPPDITKGEIYVMNADGSGGRRLTDGVAANVLPAWSPDGKQIAFASARDGYARIYAMAPNGRHQRPMTRKGISFGAYPTWSPDGRRIAFLCKKGVGPAICTVTVPGGHVTTIWKAPDYLGMLGLDWSPDGQTFVFTGFRPAPDRGDIYSVDSDGKRLRRLTTERATDEYPDWSPDGRHIVFSSDRSGLFDLYVMNSDGSEQVRLAPLPGHDDAPDWAPGTP
jgi:Tol biopolymer transport system component